MNKTLIKSFLKTSGLVKGPDDLAAVDKLLSIQWDGAKQPVSMDYTEAAMRMDGRENFMLTGTLDGEPLTFFIQAERGSVPPALLALIMGGKK